MDPRTLSDPDVPSYSIRLPDNSSDSADWTVEGPPPIRSSSLPFCQFDPTQFNPTQGFKIRLQLMMPIRTLQHSILSATCDTGRVANTYPGEIHTR